MAYPVVVQPGNEKGGMPPQEMVMTQQPQQYGMGAPMTMVQQAAPGLDYLATLDKVKIYQVLHAVEGGRIVKLCITHDIFLYSPS